MIGVGFLVLGCPAPVAWRRHQREPFFMRRREVAPPGLLEEAQPPALEPEPAPARAD